MAQQQTVAVARGALRRMILVLAVAAVMAAMVVATTAPAFAKSDRVEGFFRCVALFEAAGFSTGEAHRECAPPGRS
jgi:hypothetical protein